MKKLLIAAVAAFGLLATAGIAQAAQYKALSMTGGGGWGYAVRGSADAARNAAWNQCRQANPQSNCSNGIAVGMSWTLLGVVCNSGNRWFSVAAGSPQGYWRAWDIAMSNARASGFSPSSCWVEVQR